MNPGVVIDDRTISQLFTQIESVIENSRKQINEITAKYESLSSMDLMNKDPLRSYGDTADDFSKLCFIMQGAVDAIMDVKSIRRVITSTTSGLVPTMIKTYKYRTDNLIEQLNDLKEACSCSRSGLEARVRYMNSITYTSYDKIRGAQC